MFGGLPGTGKTTTSHMVAARLGATWLRIDAIEQAIRASAGLPDDSAAGYAVANMIAKANLTFGGTVVVDGVHPVVQSRQAWRDIAAGTAATLLEIEITCSDPVEHRRRVEARAPDLPGHALPSWASVIDHRYEHWNTRDLVIDTALMSVDDAVAAVLYAMDVQVREQQR